MIEVINRQRKIAVKTTDFQHFAEKAFAEIGETNGKTATIGFVSDEKMRCLNRDFRGKNKTTDVLSFVNEINDLGENFESVDDNFLGDVVISLEQAQRQSAENGLDFETEVKQLILHGILHLAGLDHECDSGEMNERELDLREKLGIA